MVGCCFSDCGSQKFYNEHLSDYDNKCSGGTKCCGVDGYKR